MSDGHSPRLVSYESRDINSLRLVSYESRDIYSLRLVSCESSRFRLSIASFLIVVVFHSA